MKSLLSLWRLLFCVAMAACVHAVPRINEFAAENDSGLKDEDGEYSDWIEIHNPDAVSVSLGGYYLTDNSTNLNKWRIPAGTTLAPNGYLVIFASGKNRINPATNLHANFSLVREGEFLALVGPNGSSIISSIAPEYPEQYDNVTFGVISADPMVWGYFGTPSPRATNLNGTRAGPAITVPVKDPPPPVTGPLVVTAAVRPVNDPVAGVKVYYRRMYTAETLVNMTDDGAGADAIAGDGIWSATIPATAFARGEMTRWRFVATDTKATDAKYPVYRNTIDYPQYFGTVAPDDRIQTLLPVFHWFINNPSGADSDTGARGSVYYEGHFYDNTLFSIHGQSTRGFPKKSYNVDFHPHYNFEWSTNAPKVSDIELLTNWADKSKVRHVLAYEIMRNSGVAAHFAYTVRVQQNGAFFSTADLVERGDETYLERTGLNPNGALYKVYENYLNKDLGNTANFGVEKKTRRFENNSDLQALIDGLDLTGTNLNNYIFDNIDVPRCVDMLAAASVIRNIDMHAKNWYIYRDTGRSGEWAILPWDLDLSQGRTWNNENTYFDNNIYTDGYIITGDSVRLVAYLFQIPTTRAMLMRRIRVLTDRFLQPPPPAGTPESQLYYERRLNEQLALIDPPSIVPSDARRDFEKWGSWLQTGTQVSHTSTQVAVETMAEAIQIWKTRYLPGRRSYIYNTQIVGKGGELPLPQDQSTNINYVPLVSAVAVAKAFVPADSLLGLNWNGAPVREPYDTSAWLSGATGIGYERLSGYEALIGLNVDQQMKSNNSVFIRIEFNLANTNYDKLELRMKFDDGFAAYLNGVFLVSSNAPSSPPWNATATANREAGANFDIFDVTSKKSSLRIGKNILAIQGLNDSTNSSDLLILPELYGGTVPPGPGIQPRINIGEIEVSPASGNQDQEYIQLNNPNSFAVDISDWKLAGAIDHNFIPGTVISAGRSLYVTPSAAAFRARTVSPKRGEGRFIQGGYKGHLSNIGETILLIDSTGSTNSSLTYPGTPSEAQKHLVVSEVMYNPGGDGFAEFIEILNTSSSVALDLTELKFSRGIDFGFTNSAIKTLAPGARGVIVRNFDTFTNRYGSNIPILGVFTNNSALDNAGERVKLDESDNQTTYDFTYDNVAPWPTAAAGAGFSLVLIGPETHPDPTMATNWRSSALVGGNPGTSDTVPFPAAPAGDANSNGQPDLLDYALGNDLGKPPIYPSIALQPSGTEDPPLVRFSYPTSLAAERARIEVLFSIDLVTWVDAAPYLQAGPSQYLGDGRVILNWAVNANLVDGPEAFLRLRVSPR